MGTSVPASLTGLFINGLVPALHCSTTTAPADAALVEPALASWCTTNSGRSRYVAFE